MTFSDSPWQVLDSMPAMILSQRRHHISPNVRYLGLILVMPETNKAMTVWHYTLCYKRGEERRREERRG